MSDYPALLRADYKLDMIKALQGLPISTKNAVEDSKVIKVRTIKCSVDHESFIRSQNYISILIVPYLQVLKKWVDNEDSSNSSQADSSEESAPIPEDAPPEESPVETEADRNVIEVGQHLLNTWNALKEVFKIPKKEKKEKAQPSKIILL